MRRIPWTVMLEGGKYGGLCWPRRRSVPGGGESCGRSSLKIMESVANFDSASTIFACFNFA